MTTNIVQFQPNYAGEEADVSNADRAEWGREALEHFKDVAGDDADDDFCALSDLLADLMHMCDGLEVSFSEALRCATNNHREETS